jgi:hypothetical protein
MAISKQKRGGLSVLAYFVSLAVNFFISNHPYVGIGLIIFAVIFNLYLFWPEIKLLRIAYPKGSQLESPRWLYLFGVAALGMVGLAIFLFYQAAAHNPEALSTEIFPEHYIHGKYLRIAELADSRGVIEGRTFDDCWIYGPAVLHPVQYINIIDNVFEGSPDSTFVVIEQGIPLGGNISGFIMLKDVKFEKCHFIGVTFIGVASDVEKWKRVSEKKL